MKNMIKKVNVKVFSHSEWTYTITLDCIVVYSYWALERMNTPSAMQCLETITKSRTEQITLLVSDIIFLIIMDPLVKMSQIIKSHEYRFYINYLFQIFSTVIRVNNNS